MLSVLDLMFKAFRDERVSYCHWKSNMELQDACDGIGDLDLLFDKTQYSEVSILLLRHGFKRLESQLDRQFPGVEDYVGLDVGTGKFIHLQAHYSLVTGEPLIKNYHFSIEKSVLDNIVTEQVTGVNVPNPQIESVLHVYRTFSKIGFLQFIRPKKFKKQIAGAKEELNYLLSQFDNDRDVEFFEKIFMSQNVELYLEAEKNILSPDYSFKWLSTRYKVLKDIELFQRKRSVGKYTEWFKRRSFLFYNKILFKRIPKRFFATGGSGIAIIGSDGAGKSTAVKNLDRWLGSVVQLKSFHMGRPKPSISTKIAAKLCALVQKVNNKCQLPQPGKARVDLWPNYLAWLPSWLFLSLARDRYSTFLKARRVVAKGGIALCDRYPLKGIELMDSPKISSVASIDSPFYGYLHNKEIGFYNRIVLPETPLILAISPEVAAIRQPGDGRDYVMERAGEVQDYLEKKPGYIKIVDSSCDLDVVTAKIKQCVWESL